ncbi:MAG: cytochrome C [Rhodothermales bacterium]|nr:cytochrome C [Rhodothermales bacterium]
MKSLATHILPLFIVIASFFVFSGDVPADQSATNTSSDCVTCHEQETPGAVSDWRLSKHFEEDVTCDDCHGDGHTSADDAHETDIPTADTCDGCHPERVEQFKAGKHALAWAAMKAMPTIHWQPAGLSDGMKGCGGCHKIGIKTEAEIAELKENGSGFGNASCDACHTRHTFSAEEARQPEACQTCHMGFDHPQWEMYSSSKHGVRHELKKSGALPAGAAAPTCQTCHMSDGDHNVSTPWGFLAVRLPLPENEQWAADRVTILQALGVLDPEGQPTARLEVIKAAKVARLDEAEWQAGRDKMIAICGDCHSDNFARAELQKGDDFIRDVDHLLAEAIREIVSLYEDGIVDTPESYAYAFPDLLTFHDAPTPIEQRLFVMFMKHRMRAFQGVFHANPDYALWYGWSEMVQDLSAIKHMAEGLRKDARLETERQQQKKSP